MDDDRRRTSRVKANHPVTMQSSEKTIMGEVRDLSSGGAFIDCAEPFDPGEIFDLSIDIPDKARSPSTKAQVVWTSSRGMGVKFLPESDWTDPLEEQTAQ
jgi:hypothetical protein